MHLTIVAPRPPVDHGQTNPHCVAGWHGTSSAYRHGCRCPEACEARRVYDKRLREGRAQSTLVESTGTRRRLHALVAIGWRWCDLAARFAVGRSAVQMWAKGDRVHVDTYHRVRVVYDAMWDTPGSSSRSRVRARRMGWAPPQAWDDDEIDNPDAAPQWGGPADKEPDEVAVHKALGGALKWRNLTDPDRVEVARLAANEGGRTALIRTLGISASTLVEWTRRAVGEAA